MKPSTILSIITLGLASSASALPSGSGGSGGQCNQGYASCCNGGLCSAALNVVGVGQVCVAPAVFVCCNNIAVVSKLFFYNSSPNSIFAQSYKPREHALLCLIRDAI